MKKPASFARLSSLILALAISSAAHAEGIALDGKPALDFDIEEMSFGTEKSLAEFEGKVVLLEFWFLG